MELLEKLEQTSQTGQATHPGGTGPRPPYRAHRDLRLPAQRPSPAGAGALPQAGSTWIPSKTLEAEKDRPADLQHLTGCAGMACYTRNSSIPRPGVCRPPYALGEETS